MEVYKENTKTLVLTKKVQLIGMKAIKGLFAQRNYTKRNYKKDINVYILTKKAQSKECDYHRIISLMPHILKILHARIHLKLESDINETQFGF